MPLPLRRLHPAAHHRQLLALRPPDRDLAYDQITTACRLLVVQIMDQQTRHRLPARRSAGRRDAGRAATAWPQALRRVPRTTGRSAGPRRCEDYSVRRHQGRRPPGPTRPPDHGQLSRSSREFQHRPRRSRRTTSSCCRQGMNLYYGAVRASRVLPRLPPPAPARPRRGRPARRHQDRGAHRARSRTTSTATAPC